MPDRKERCKECGGNLNLRGVGSCHCSPDRKEPRPLEYVWVRWEPTIYPKTKWHLFSNKKSLQYTWRRAGAVCSVRIADVIWDIEVTADTPPQDQCCKKCWEKVKPTVKKKHRSLGMGGVNHDVNRSLMDD